MKIFLDTSSLFSLYHQESGTEELEHNIEKITITHIFLSELSKIEFVSSVWKKVRTKEITINLAKRTIGLFEKDFDQFNFVSIDAYIITQAKNLLAEFGIEGLRTLDSIQLSTCIFLSKQVDIFFRLTPFLIILLNERD